MLSFHDPRGEKSQSEETYELSCDVTANAGKGITLGLLANGFPDSENFLRHIGDVFKEQLPGLEIKVWNKGNASIPAPESMLEDIRKSCQAVVAAYGHWGSCTTGTVRDGINTARLGIPAVSLVTEDFWPQGNFVAQALGMPSFPRVQLPHPLAGTGSAHLRSVAESMLAAIIGGLKNA